MEVKHEISWTEEEIEILKNAYNKYNNKWSKIRDQNPKIAKYYPNGGYKKKLEELNNIGSIECVCKRLLTEKNLFNVGLYCECGIKCLDLAKRIVVRVTYLIFDENNPIYVGTSKTLYDRLIQHSKDKIRLDISKHTIKVSLLHSEIILTKIFKPTLNIIQNNNADMVTFSNGSYKNNNYNKLSFVYYRDLSKVKYPWHREGKGDHQSKIRKGIFSDDIILKKKNDEDNSLFSCGVIFGNVKIIDMKYCFIKDITECRCSIVCSVRSIINSFKNLNKWQPIENDLVKENILRNEINIKEIDYSIGKGLPVRTKEFLTEVVIRNKTIKDTTKKAYIENIKLLYNEGLLENSSTYEILYDWLNDVVFIKYSESRNQTLLNVISLLFNQTTLKEKLLLWGNDWFTFYRKFTIFNKYYKEKLQRDYNDKSNSEDKNWIEYPKLLEIVEEERKNIMEKFKDKKNINELQKYVILMLHVKQAALRNDYNTVMLFDYDENKDNYLVWEDKIVSINICGTICINDIDYIDGFNREYKFVFNEYKTSKFLGRYEIDVKDDVKEDLALLVDYRIKTGSKYLIIRLNGNCIDSPGYSQMLTEYTQKLTGKSIGSSLLRKIYISHMRKNELTNKESKELAKNMMHSEEIQRSLYRKV